MINTVPYQKLRLFQQKLDLDRNEMETLAPYRELFIKKKDAFAEFFFDFFLKIPDTSVFLEHTHRPGFLKEAWSHWFENLFGHNLDDDFLAYLWRIGNRHVEVNLDHRFTNLGFAMVRQFCHRVILEEISKENSGAVSNAVDKLLDFCILVETNAFIDATTRCDLEIIRGIADKVRNPVTVIGGNIRRLQKRIAVSSPAYETYRSMMIENSRLERMVTDIKTYIEMFQEDPLFQDVSLERSAETALDRLRAEKNIGHVRIEVAIDPGASTVIADKRDMEQLLYYLLQNALEAVDPGNPVVKICSLYEKAPLNGIRLEIFNTGTTTEAKDVEKFFSPFFSTKREGTGFGLPIAQLAVRKNYGKLSIQPVLDEGMTVIVSLPAHKIRPQNEGAELNGDAQD